MAILPRGLRQGLRRALNRAANLLDAPRLILTYHRIGEDGEPDPDRLAVAPQRLAEHLRILAGLRVVPLDGLQAARGPALAITFDDGYADNLTLAAPLLAAAQLPATVFVTAGFIDRSADAWWDQLAQLCCSPWGLPAATPEGVPTADRQMLYHELAGRLLVLPEPRLAQELTRLWTWSGHQPAARPSRRFLRADEVRQLAASPGIAIGAHGMSHGSLGLLPAADCQRELRESRQRLTELTAQPINTLAYPYGTPRDAGPAVVAAARAAGFAVAVTTDPGQVHRWSAPLRLRRHTVRDWPGAEFARRLAGFWTRSDHGERP